MKNNIKEQIREKEQLLNLKLRKVEPRVIQLYLQLKEFIAELESTRKLKDHNFCEHLYGYRASYNWHKRRGDAIIEAYTFGCLDLYIEDKEYRDAWNHDYIDSRRGELSILWEGLDRALNEQSKAIFDIGKIEVVIQVQYQVMVNTSAIVKSKHLDRQDKLEEINKALINRLQKLTKIKELEREETARLHKIGLLDTDRVSGGISLFSNNHRVNHRHDVLRGDPYFETSINWTFLEQLETLRIQDLRSLRTDALKDLTKTNRIWLEHNVDYVIHVDLAN